MPLEFVSHHFTSEGGSSAIRRSFIDMPIVPKKLCVIRQVHVHVVQLDRPRQSQGYDLAYAISIDPDHVLQSTVLLDSTIFVSGVWQTGRHTSVGFEFMGGLPWIFHFPEGMKCPHSRLPLFVQHSNTNTLDTDWVIRIFFEFVSLTPQELAVAVLRRGRGVTRD